MMGIIAAQKRSEGQALIVAMIFLLALTFMGFGLITVATIDIHSARNLRMAEEALSVAEQGALIGMALASDPAQRFAQRLIGDSVSVSGEINTAGGTSTKYFYDTSVVMRGKAATPEREQVGKTGSTAEISYVTVEIKSEGWVSTGAFSFGPTTKPGIRRSVEILARIRVAG